MASGAFRTSEPPCSSTAASWISIRQPADSGVAILHPPETRKSRDDAMQGAWQLTKYPEDVLYPISFDSAGAKANMRGFFDIAEMQAKGTQPETLKRLIRRRP